MRATLLVMLSLGCVVPIAWAAERDAASVLPSDVVEFKERRDLCDHFRDEPLYDAERAKFLGESAEKYCKGTDKELALLKTKYKNNKKVLRALGIYEEKIERNK